MTPPVGEGDLHGGIGAAVGSGPPPSSPAPSRWWRIRGGTLPLDRPLLMGIVNRTPDSFSDGGRWTDLDVALEHAAGLVAQGAHLLDIGGESTRPGAAEVPEAEELDRVLPLVEATRALGVPLSVDTRKAAVARAALEAGASVVNDVSGFARDPEMAPLVASTGAGAVLMHMRGEPATMASLARYGDVAREVAAELAEAVGRARGAGVSDDALVVDPGLGFAKTPEQTLALLGGLGPILELGFPVLVGPSRKRFIASVSGAPPEDRLPGTVAACVLAYLGGARIFRVHDVAPVAQALAVARAATEAGDTRTGEGRRR